MFRLNVEKSFVKRPEPFKTFICKLLLAGVNEWRIPSFRGWSHLHLTVEQKKGGEFFFRRLFFPNFYNFFRFLQLRFCFAWFCFSGFFFFRNFFFKSDFDENWLQVFLLTSFISWPLCPRSDLGCYETGLFLQWRLLLLLLLLLFLLL